MAPARFTAANSVVLDSSGRGEITLAPPASGGGWNVELTTVYVSTRVAEPTFRLYLNGVSPVNLLEGSYSGAQDSSDTSHRVEPGSALVGVWEGGDPGARATLRVSGTQGA